ncbi:hypothetical protein [Rubrobacter tropicus]|uniref:hypothetical protein n=1 Tax=Rubrobacter tropicus TaxID=2653851 RepID=UPI001A9F8E2E|nr:hypothetical protein [Rubrobacter tropicus]
MAPEATGVAQSTVRVGLAPGILALNRFTMTLQNKRMPATEIRVDADAKGTSIEIGLDCPEESARRYAVLLENMEDVRELHFAGAAPENRAGSSIDYDGRRFRSVENSGTGEVGPETVFDYSQDGNVVSATYEGGDVRFGTLVATVDEDGNLDARYGHVNASGELMTGECRSTPEVLADGRIRLHEEWRWTSGDGSSGRSVVEEIGD